MKRLAFFLTVVTPVLSLLTCQNKSHHTPLSVKETMDGVVTRLYQTHSKEQLDTLNENYILSFLSREEKRSLATQYWQFEVNVPVTVSLMRHVGQKVTPFWLTGSGFTKTDMLVKNQEYTYEVWQKAFDPGKVHLGINGFDKHRPVYFISVGTVNPEDDLTISNVFPAGQHFEIMEIGAFTYHDWDELTITELPDALRDHTLFTTIRGRAREAHLIGAFRETPYPSGPEPDQVMLTWSGDPSSTIDIQWRTDTSLAKSKVYYWPQSSHDTSSAMGSKYLMEDRLLHNDRYIHRFTAKLRGLLPGTIYNYTIDGRSEAGRFRTAGQNKESFSFIWFGDTHKSEAWGRLIQKTLERHPETAFYSIAGDVVSTGLNRDDWDALFHHSGGVFAQKPLMPVPGNHDNQDGLGAWMYQEMFSLPENGPEDVGPELTYAFNYQNTLFLMIDATAPVTAQTQWVEQQLSGTDADWKFAMFHFPPYSWEEDYQEIRDKWCTLFDKYHVDMVMSGHVHYYMRSKPIHNQYVVDNHSKGTVYAISIGIPTRVKEMPPEDYAAVRNTEGLLYQHMEISEKKLSYKAINLEGKVIDEFSIHK